MFGECGALETPNTHTHTVPTSIQTAQHQCSETSTRRTPVYIGGHLLPSTHPHSYVCHQYVLCPSCVHCLKFCNICVYSSILIKNTKTNPVSVSFNVDLSRMLNFKLLKRTNIGSTNFKVCLFNKYLIHLMYSA